MEIKRSEFDQIVGEVHGVLGALLVGTPLDSDEAAIQATEKVLEKLGVVVVDTGERVRPFFMSVSDLEKYDDPYNDL